MHVGFTHILTVRFDNGQKQLRMEDVSLIFSYFQAHPRTAALIQELK